MWDVIWMSSPAHCRVLICHYYKINHCCAKAPSKQWAGLWSSCSDSHQISMSLDLWHWTETAASCSLLKPDMRKSPLPKASEEKGMKRKRSCFSPFFLLCFPLRFSQETSSSTSLTSSSVPVLCSPILSLLWGLHFRIPENQVMRYAFLWRLQGLQS